MIVKVSDIREENIKYIETPDYLWDRALEEKKSSRNLDNWIFWLARTRDSHYDRLYNYLKEKAGYNIQHKLERIEVISE